MKKVLAVMLALLMVFGMFGCVSKADMESVQAERDQLQQELDALKNKSAEYTVHVLNATVDGKSSVTVTKETELTATAELEDGQVVDSWLVGGKKQKAEGDTLVFTVRKDTVVQAVVRPEKKVTTINAELRFLDEKGKAAGDALTEFVFEKDYENPVTKETCEGGKISCEIKAVVPAGKVVDHWKINGVPYYYNTGISSFVVEDLDEATEYEVVLKEKPVTYYKVTTSNCTYGGGNTSGTVAAGTKLTFTCNGGHPAKFYVNDVQVADNVKSITITINSNTHVAANAIIN